MNLKKIFKRAFNRQEKITLNACSYHNPTYLLEDLRIKSRTGKKLIGHNLKTLDGIVVQITKVDEFTRYAGYLINDTHLLSYVESKRVE